MTRGPIPKPTALKILEGNPGKRRLEPDNEPKPGPGKPLCPGWFDAVAKRTWRRVIKELDAMGLLSSADTETLAAYCHSYATFTQAAKVVKEKGLTMRFGGGVIQRPEVGIAQREKQIMRALASEFGLTPSGRSRIKLGSDQKPEDPLEKLLRDL